MSVSSTVSTVIATVAMAMAADGASAQTYPVKPVRILTSEVGGGGDFASRILAQGLAESLGQPVIVDNRPSNLMGEIAAKALPDGYTLLIEGLSFWIAPLLQKMPYDLARDFAPITAVTFAPWVLVVHPAVPAKSVRELMDLVKSKPGEINYASAGIGGGAHLAGEMFKSMTGLNIVHIPYRGSGAAALGMIGGQVQMMFANPPAVTPHIKSGKLRALAVTSAQPSALFPGLPPVAASGLPGYEITVATALFAPAKTQSTAISRLNQDSTRVLHRPEIKERFFNTGVEAVGNSAEELSAIVKTHLTKWRKVIADAGIRAD